MNIFALLCIVFLFGCFCGIKFAAINIFLIVISVVFIFAVKLAVFKLKTLQNLCVLAIIVSFSCGAGLGIYNEHKTFSRVYPLCGTNVTVSGSVDEADDESFVISTDYGCITVYNYIYADVKRGDTVTVEGSFFTYDTAQYNGDFNSRHHYAVNGIVGYISCEKVKVTGHFANMSVWEWGIRLREKLVASIDKFNVSDRCKGLVTALLTGNTELLDDKVKDSFSKTGTSHIIAVSGLHVSIFLSFFILFVKGMRKNKLMNALFAIMLVLLYMLFIGGRASVLRAGIMSIIGYCVFSIKRRSDPLMNLATAGVLICLVNPYYVASPGFQMSFLATLGIVIFAEHFKCKAVAVPVISTLFMLPVTVYYYNNLSFTVIFANIIVVFLVPLIIFTGYIGFLVPMFMYISFAIAEFVITVADFFASMEFLHFNLPAPDMRQFIMHFLVVCAAFFCFVKKRYGITALILSAVIVIYVNGLLLSATAEKSVVLRYIGCGNYNMEHITTENGYEIFVDCGEDAVDYTVDTGIGNIFAVIITDTSGDRYSGIEELCREGNVRYVVLPEKLRDENFNLEKSVVLYYNQDGCKFSIDNVIFRFCYDGEEKSLLIQLYDDVVAVALDKTVSDIQKCTVLSVPHNCQDCDTAVENDTALYYVHPSCIYKSYDCHNKYITAHTGSVDIVFKNGKKPVINGGDRD